MPCIRYADDIILLAKSERAAERLMESSTKYLEETLKLRVNREKSRTVSVKLRVNREKSRTVSVFAIRNFKYLGFCFGKNGKGIYIRVHGKDKSLHERTAANHPLLLDYRKSRKRKGAGNEQRNGKNL